MFPKTRTSATDNKGMANGRTLAVDVGRIVAKAVKKKTKSSSSIANHCKLNSIMIGLVLPRDILRKCVQADL